MESFLLLDDTRSDPSVLLPMVYLGEGSMPSQCNARTVHLPGGLESDLNWHDALQTARGYIAQGLKIFWKCDLGLFSALRAPLSDQAQYLALSLALKHFRETIWPEFCSVSVGMSLYNGSLDFSQQIAWDVQQITLMQEWLTEHFQTTANFTDQTGIAIAQFEQLDQHFLFKHAEGKRLLRLFACNTAVEFIELLARHLPGELAACILLDTSVINDPLELAQLLTKERFGRLHRAITGDTLPVTALALQKQGWLSHVAYESMESLQPTLGICLPVEVQSLPRVNTKLNRAIAQLKEEQRSFRFIPEALLTGEWGGLDELVVVSECMSAQGIRKLKGFCAAGGCVLTLGHSLGLPNESEFRIIRND
ncbi:MAG: hypothetical protein H0X51_04665 [Parachlamydiaceae bacterium]|nr:hypothetical protein [Parachlamydiaceae bacterium]